YNTPSITVLHHLSLHDALPIFPQAAPFDRRTAVDFCFLCPWRTIKILLTSLQNKAINPKRSNVVPGLVCSRYANVEEWATPSKKDRKSTRLNSSHGSISYAVFC